MGPIVGTAFFNWRIGKTRKQQMSEKEVEFYKRVKKYRVDPTGGSVANPVPGECGPSFMAEHQSLHEAIIKQHATGSLLIGFRLLRREDRQRGGIPAMAEGSTSLQQEAAHLCLSYELRGEEYHKKKIYHTAESIMRTKHRLAKPAISYVRAGRKHGYDIGGGVQ